MCGKEFYAPHWLEIQNGAKYCSYKCYWESKIGKKPWNKGLKGTQDANSGSFGHSETKWKGTLKEYKKLHHWVGSYLGKPEVCSNCGQVKIGKDIHWANKSGKYKKDINDWIRLCAKCHYKFDKADKRRGI